MQKKELESYISKLENVIFRIADIMSTVAEMRKDFTVAPIDANFLYSASLSLNNATYSLEEVKKMRQWERAEWRSKK